MTWWACLDCGRRTRNGPRCRAHSRQRDATKDRGDLDDPAYKAARFLLLSDPDAHCARCGTTTDLTADHVVPRAHGGTWRQGLVVLCRPCNGARGTTDLATFLATPPR